MAHLTMRQIAGYVLAAGFKGEHAAEAVAVAWAESKGDTQATNSSSGTRGLWQIHPYWHREVSDAAAYDPGRAAQAAFRISSHGTSWSQWSTWPSAAASYLAQARTAVGAPAKTGATAATPAGFLSPGGGLPGWTNVPGWLGFFAKTEAAHAAEGAAADAAMTLVRAAAPVMLTVGLVGGGLALVLVGAHAATKGKGAPDAGQE